MSLQNDRLEMTTLPTDAFGDALSKSEEHLANLATCRGSSVLSRFRDVLVKWRDGQEVSKRDAEALREICWEKLHTGHWSEVEITWREAYALAQLCCVAVLWREHGEDAVDQMLKELDLAIVMGGSAFRPEIEKLLQFFGEKTVRKRRGEFRVEAAKRPKTCVNDLPLKSLQRPPGRSPPLETSPALEDFSQRYLTLSSNPEPCVLKGIVEQWPAFGKWNDLEYFHERFGYRTVPVEVGQHYLAANWGQKLMTVTDFLARYVVSGSLLEEKGYLAQHPLFDQIPELKDDICIPEYCCLSLNDAEPLIHAWFGPVGTVSPLHYDRSQNILAQVVGRKYVRLYTPSQSDALLPIPSFINKNSSQIDLDDPQQLQKHGIADLEFVDCILEAGDALFIPKGWWHYIRSLDVSFSVSFWWDSA